MLVELNLLYKLNYCLEKSFFESRVFINLSAFINNNFFNLLFKLFFKEHNTYLFNISQFI